MGISYHLKRVRHQLGWPVRLGGRAFRARGYHADTLLTDFDREPLLEKVLHRLLRRREGTFVDIGTNAGQTLIKLLSLDPGRAYIGFEPLLDQGFFVDRFIRDNAILNARVIAIALSDTNSVVEVVRPYPDAGRERVPSRAAGEVLSELNLDDIGIIKIDIEGLELEVLRGLAPTLRALRPTLLFKVPPNFTGEERTMLPDEMVQINNARAEAMRQLLCDLDYRLVQIDRQGEEIEIDRFNIEEPALYRGRDYVAYPETAAGMQ